MKKLSCKNLRGSALLAATLILASSVVPAFAAAPMAKTNAPGFFRMMLGNFEVTAISDGTVDLPVDTLLMNTTPAKVNEVLAKSFLKSPLQTSDNTYLINTGDKLILIDTGAGALFGPTLGKFLANLKASGYQPEQIDEIYITHMHPDHVGGLSANGQPVFPNAIVRADKREADYWLSQTNLDKAPDAKKGFFQGAMSSLSPYVSAGKFKPFEGNGELTPGIRSYAENGHTPGHNTYVVESQDQRLVLIGDLIHVAAMQFDNPSITISFDSEPQSAEKSRKAEFANAAKSGDLLGGAHLQFPGLGHIKSQGKGYQWIPVNYTQLR